MSKDFKVYSTFLKRFMEFILSEFLLNRKKKVQFSDHTKKTLSGKGSGHNFFKKILANKKKL